MKRFSILACVLGFICLQSCTSSSGHKLDKPKTVKTIPTIKKLIVSEYRGIKIDTTIDETTFFVSRVDDAKGLAYGSYYQFDNAMITELAVVVPYQCMKWDSVSHTHMLLMHEFRTALATDSLSHMFVQNRTLTGHKYRNVDARM